MVKLLGVGNFVSVGGDWSFSVGLRGDAIKGGRKSRQRENDERERGR